MQLLSDAEVITVVDRAVATKDEARAGEAGNELMRRWKTADRAVLAQAAADPSLTMETRGVMIDMLAGDADQITSEARFLLADPDLEQELKARIIATSNFSVEDSDLLADFAGRSDILGFQAFKKLARTDAARADALATQKVSSSNRDHHGGTAVTPQSQAQSHLTLVTTALP